MNDSILGQHLLNGPIYSPHCGWDKPLPLYSNPLSSVHLNYCQLDPTPHTPTPRIRVSPSGPPVESDELLPQDGVHGFLVDHRVQVHDHFHVKVTGKLGEYVLGQFLNHVLKGQRRRESERACGWCLSG